MICLDSGGHLLGLDEKGQVCMLAGAGRVNRVIGAPEPIWRLVTVSDGHREEWRPAGRPRVAFEADQVVLQWKRCRETGGRETAFVVTVRIGPCTTPGGGGFRFDLILHTDEHKNVVEVVFPVVGGLGGDVLFMPHHAGERIVQPASTLKSDRYIGFSRAGSRPVGGGRFVREITYCGLASMSWLELDHQDGGTYLGSHDPAFHLTGLIVETDGHTLTLAVRRWCQGEHGTWDAPPALLVPHDGDWHTGARIYRNWIQPLLPSPQRPTVMEGRVAINPRYDFKNGGIVRHRFTEIPEMYAEGAAVGLDHFFIAGWNRGGFDAQYPEYYPDMELGSPGDLARGCAYISDNGGVTTFYVNARLFDVNSSYYPTVGRRWAVKDERGEQIFETYAPNRFAVMCPAHAPWQEHLVGTAEWLIRATGCEGIYLDQLGSATPYPCFDPEHAHGHPACFNHGYMEILDRLRPLAALMIENCGDIYSSRVWASYVWNGELYDEFFNLYRYTFPEHRLVCRVHPRPMADRALRKILFYRDLHRAWLLGAYFWASPDRRFGPDDGRLRQDLIQVVALRRLAEPWLAEARFLDSDGLRLSGATGVHAARFEGPAGSVITIVNPRGEEGALVVETPFKTASVLRPGLREPVGWNGTQSHLPLPRDALSLIILR